MFAHVALAQHAVEREDRGRRRDAGLFGDALAQHSVGIEAEARALAAVPADHVDMGMRQQPRRAEHAVPVVVVLVGIARAEHRNAREMPGHLGKVGEDRRGHALHHDIARRRDRADRLGLLPIPAGVMLERSFAVTLGHASSSVTTRLRSAAQLASTLAPGSSPANTSAPASFCRITISGSPSGRGAEVMRAQAAIDDLLDGGAHGVRRGVALAHRRKLDAFGPQRDRDVRLRGRRRR